MWRALYDRGLPAADIDALLEAAVRSDGARERDVAHGLIVSVFRDRRVPWAAALIAKARAENWGNTALLAILRAPCQPLDLGSCRPDRRGD